MKNKIILAILILSMIALIFSGCGGGNPVTPPTESEEETIIPDTTKIIDEETESQLTSVSSDQSEITFTQSTPQLEELQIGDILFIGVTDQTPYGLLRKVTNIKRGSRADDTLTVNTEFTTLEEAVEELHFSLDTVLTQDDIDYKRLRLPPGVSISQNRGGFEYGHTFNLSDVSPIYEGDPSTTIDDVTIDGEIDLNYEMIFNLDIGFFKLNNVEFRNIVESYTDLDVTIGGSLPLSNLLNPNPIHLFTIPFIPIPVAPLLVITPIVYINLGLDGEVYAKSTVGVTIDQTGSNQLESGFEYDNGQWHEIENDPVFDLEPKEPKLSLGGYIKPYAGPELELILNGCAGVYGSLYGNLELQADINDDPWWSLYGGFDVILGAHLEILSFDLGDPKEWKIFTYRKEILSADGPFGGINKPPVISNLSTDPPSVNINQTTTITCIASDPDGDPLTYTWTKTGGTFEGSTSGSSIIWRAPSISDTYTVVCGVSDGDESDSKSVNIEVTSITGSQYVIQWSNAESNGWANPLGEGEELITSTAYDYNSDIYLSNWGKKHTGTDIISELDGNVYSIASGTIVKITRDYSSTSNQSVVIIKHTNSNNEDFFAIYGHVLARGDLEVNSELEVGEKIGTIKKAGSPVHLHFGINLSSKITDFMFTNSDGQWGWGRIPAFANPSDYGWVDPIDYLNTYLLLSSLTPEEVELIRKWGFGGDDIVRRWPDSHVDVYDETNYTRIQDVLNEWNTAIGGPIVFRLSSDPNSPVKVKFDPDLSQDLAGQYLIYCSDDYEFYRADVNIQKNYLDSLDSDTKYCLYLWLFNGAAGFNVQADVDPNPFKEWWIFDKIPDDIKTMLRGLYKVPCGYNLLDKKLKENWTRPIVKNLQNIYEGGLYKLCK